MLSQKNQKNLETTQNIYGNNYIEKLKKRQIKIDKKLNVSKITNEINCVLL